MSNLDSISNALNMKPFTEEKLPSTVVKVQSNDDFEYARNNIKEIINQSNDILSTVISQVKENGTPRSVEVLSEFIRTCVDINKELVLLTSSKNTNNETNNQNTSTTNNTVVFNGTTDDLQRYLKEMNIFDNQ